MLRKVRDIESPHPTNSLPFGGNSNRERSSFLRRQLKTILKGRQWCQIFVCTSPNSVFWKAKRSPQYCLSSNFGKPAQKCLSACCPYEEMLTGLPFLSIEIVGNDAFHQLTERTFVNHLRHVPEGRIEVMP